MDHVNPTHTTQRITFSPSLATPPVNCAGATPVFVPPPRLVSVFPVLGLVSPLKTDIMILPKEAVLPPTTICVAPGANEIAVPDTVIARQPGIRVCVPIT
jgi:hypothetical protein